jgi:hypothetical protein
MYVNSYSQVDYGYHDISKEDKVVSIIKKMKAFRIFADVYQGDKTKKSVLFLNATGCKFVEDTPHMDLSFKPGPGKGCFLFNGAHRIYSEAALRLVSSHFEETQKTMESVPSLYGPFTKEGSHFESPDRKLRAKVTTVSRSQLENLGTLHGIGREGFFSNGARMSDDDHASARSEVHNQRIQDWQIGRASCRERV